MSSSFASSPWELSSHTCLLGSYLLLVHVFTYLIFVGWYKWKIEILKDGGSQIVKEGLMPGFATFLAVWILCYNIVIDS